MADRIVLNTPRWKGEYEFDLDTEPLTSLEWRWVKKISGYLPLTVEDGWRGGDPDLFVAFAVVALVRAGKVQKADAISAAEQLADLPFDGAAITLVGDPDEDEAESDPPPVPADPPETETPSRSSGGSGRPTSVSAGADPSRIGAPA